MGGKFIPVTLAVISLLVASCGTPEERAAEYLVKAQEYYDQDDYVSARIEAMNAAQIEPRNAQVRYLLAQIEEQQQDFRKAVGHLQVAVDADPDHLESHIKLGNYYVLANAADLASKELDEAKRLEPGNPEVMLLESRLAFLQQDMELAMQKVDESLGRDPSNVDATMFKSGLMMAEGDMEQAMQLTEEAMQRADRKDQLKLRKFRILMLRSSERYEEIEAELNALLDEYPEDESVILSLAQLYVTLERIDEAEKLFREFVDRDPTDIGRQIEFARFQSRQRGDEAAKKSLEEFIEQQPDSNELKIALARLEEQQENFDAAYDIYGKIAQSAPTSVAGYEARNRMAVINIQKGETELAREQIDAILTDDQNNADALLVRAAFSFTDQNYNDAVADLRMVLREEAESQRALLLLARSHNAADNRELAQDAYRRLLDLNPNNAVAASELADLLSRSGDAPMAEEVLREQLNADPENRGAASRLIQNLLVQGNLEEAEVQARSMLEFSDDSGLAEFQLGRVLQAKESNQEAIEAYKQALEKNPGAVEPLQGLVSILVNSGQPEEALIFLEDYLLEYPELNVTRLLKATVHARMGDKDKAAAEYEEVIRRAPKAIRAYAQFGALYPDNALKRREILRRGVDANPENAQIALLLASDYEQGSEIAAAIELYEQILSYDEDNVIATNNLAALLLDNRSDEESFQRALEMSRSFETSGQAALLDTLGWAYYRNGDYGNAIRVLEQAVELEKDVALLRYHLGMAFVKADMTVRGREQLNKALELAEQDFVGIDEARETLASL